ncbi:MAG: N-acetylmuramoyl-L-alanine amidase, partial [Oscillospiraceae bacterium]
QDTINMATLIYDEVVSVAAQSKRGVKKGNFAVTRETNMRAALLELCFISNSRDNELYDTYFERYVDAIARGICKYFG